MSKNQHIPARTAWELHKAWEGSKLVIVPDAGHSADEPGTEAAMVEAIERMIAKSGRV